MGNYSVFGVGNALMDMICRVSSAHLNRLGATPGTMTLVDAECAARIATGGERLAQRPGGSCANTLRGIAWLTQRDGVQGTPAPPVMTGMIGDDPVGRDLIFRMEDASVATRLTTHPTEPTGTSSVLVTPDGQRTMFTSLGACRWLSPQQLDRAALAASSCFYATAFLWGRSGVQEALCAGAVAARDGGALIAFDMADPLVAQTFGRELLEWMPGAVDLLFANEQEAQTLAALIDGTAVVDAAPEVAYAALATLAPTVVVKLGAEGCLVWRQGEVVARVLGVSAKAIDTVGAGDSFAAGYLYGMLSGGSPTDSATLGNRLAAAIVEVEGCDYPAVAPGFSV